MNTFIFFTNIHRTHSVRYKKSGTKVVQISRSVFYESSKQEPELLMVRAKLAVDKNEWNSRGLDLEPLWARKDSKLMICLTPP